MPSSHPQVVILAGGRGERLRPMTDSIPKPLVMVNGMPFLTYLLRILRTHGFTRLILCVGYLHKKIIDCFGDGSRLDVQITYSIEKEPAGTGGAIKQVAHLLDGDFFVLNGDTFLAIDYQKIYEAYQACRQPGLLVIHENRDGALDKNNIRIEEGRVVEYSKSSPREMHHIDAGVGVFNRQVLDLFPDCDRFSFEETIFPKLIQTGGLAYYLSPERYYDIGTPKRLKEFEKYVKTLDENFSKTPGTEKSVRE